MPQLVISIGSNTCERLSNVEKAQKKVLQLLLPGAKVSEIYETPCALNSESVYFNAVIIGEYEGEISTLECILKKMEEQFGRDAICRHQGLVPIDIDIVVCDGKVLKEWDFRQLFFRKGYDSLLSQK